MKLRFLSSKLKKNLKDFNNRNIKTFCSAVDNPGCLFFLIVIYRYFQIWSWLD